MEIFTLVTGLLFLYLEIRQNNWMWAVQALTGAASVYIFFQEGLYATMALNAYYVATAVWGMWSWRKDKATAIESLKMQSEDKPKPDEDNIHLRRLHLKTVCISIIAQIAGTAALYHILRPLGDAMSLMDSGITVLSIIATWWLIQTYKEQWILWIIADLLTFVMCLSQGLYLMAALYIFYTFSAIYGYIHWKSRGIYVDTAADN